MFGKAFADFTKSHLSHRSVNSEELDKKMGVRPEAVIRLNGESARRYFDLKTNQEVGQKEYWDRRHQYDADQYASFLKRHEALYKAEYPHLRQINEKYVGKIPDWALSPYLPTLDANGNINYGAVKADLLEANTEYE